MTSRSRSPLTFAWLQGSPFEDLRDVTRDDIRGDARRAGGRASGQAGERKGGRHFQATVHLDEAFMPEIWQKWHLPNTFIYFFYPLRAPLFFPRVLRGPTPSVHRDNLLPFNPRVYSGPRICLHPRRMQKACTIHLISRVPERACPLITVFLVDESCHRVISSEPQTLTETNCHEGSLACRETAFVGEIVQWR